MYVNALSDSRTYSIMGRDRQYTIRMQRANAMVERIKNNPLCNLEVIDDVGMKFFVRIQTIHKQWYAVNLGNKCCECEDRVSIWKHVIVVRKLVDEKFTYLKHILSIEKDGFVNNLNDVGEDDVDSPSQNSELSPLSIVMDDIGVQDDNIGIV